MSDILHGVTIAAPPGRVFDAITTAEGLRSWWTPDCTAEPAVGSVAVFKFYGGEVVFRMRIDELEPEKRVAWTCIGDWEEWNGTTLSFDLARTEDDGTELRFAHKGWRSVTGEYPKCNTVWGGLMLLLRDYAEGKPTRPYFAR